MPRHVESSAVNLDSACELLSWSRVLCLSVVSLRGTCKQGNVFYRTDVTTGLEVTAGFSISKNDIWPSANQYQFMNKSLHRSTHLSATFQAFLNKKHISVECKVHRLDAPHINSSLPAKFLYCFLGLGLLIFRFVLTSTFVEIGLSNQQEKRQTKVVSGHL